MEKFRQYPNLIKFALSEKNIDDQEELFQRNKKRNGEKNIEIVHTTGSQSTEESEAPFDLRYRKELEEIKRKLTNLENF